MADQHFIREDHFTCYCEVDESTGLLYTGVIPWSFILTQKNEHTLVGELKCEHVDKLQSWSVDTMMKVRLGKVTVKGEMVFDSKKSTWKCDFNYSDKPYKIQTGREYKVVIATLIWKTEGIRGLCIDFSTPSHNSDVVLLVEGKKVHANKMLLSIHSTVFAAMFSGNFEESGEKEVELVDTEHRFFIDLLSFLYPGCPIQINEYSVYSIMKTADKFNVQHVFMKCVQFLMTTTAVRNTRKFLLADEYSLDNLRENVVKELDHDSIERLRNSRQFSAFKSESKLALFNRIVEIQSTEDTDSDTEGSKAKKCRYI